jgi:hypothetical protein
MSSSEVLCVCQLCSKKFTTKAAWYRKGAGKFCSRTCSSRGKSKPKNYHLELSCKNCGNIFSVKRYREHTAIACSDSCRQVLWAKTYVGNKSPNWKGGISDSRSVDKRTKEYKEWRSSVYSRDNYTCQKCGDCSGGNLHAHHISNYSSSIDLRYCADNGITLCNNCHNPSVKGSFHNIYGTRNNTKEQLIEFLNKQIRL